MIYTWRITFEVRDIAGSDSMIVRAPTAEDALTMFKVKGGSVPYKILEMSLFEAIDPKLVNCPICLREWPDHLDPERRRSEDGARACVFQRGWVMERQLDERERAQLRLPKRSSS